MEQGIVIQSSSSTRISGAQAAFSGGERGGAKEAKGGGCWGHLEAPDAILSIGKLPQRWPNWPSAYVLFLQLFVSGSVVGNFFLVTEIYVPVEMLLGSRAEREVGQSQCRVAGRWVELWAMG